MTVKELIEKLSSLESDAQVLIRFMNSEGCKDIEVFDKDDVKTNCHTVILDISNK